MTDPLASPVTDPTALYAVRDGLYAADMLIAAVSGLDFFTWLDGHPGTVDEIAAHLGFHRRPVDVMTTLFVAMGLIDRDGARLRAAAPAREHLVAHSRWYLGPYYPKAGQGRQHSRKAGGRAQARAACAEAPSERVGPGRRKKRKRMRPPWSA